MANLKEVRTRIASVSSMQQITNAMKMVAASKFRKAQVAMQKSQPYSKKLLELLQNVSSNAETGTIYAQERPLEDILLIAVASNKGLCGAFNSNIAKKTQNRIKEYLKQDKYITIHVLTIGSRVSDFFKAEKYPHWTFNNAILDSPDTKNIAAFANDLMNSFLKAKYNKIEFIYNKFKNATTQIVTVENFLPIESKHLETQNANFQTDYIIEPNREEIIEQLTTITLQTQIHQILLNSSAAEHGSRMITMQKATDNADELLKGLKLSYNKARQSAITNEIIEIISGAQAME